MSAVLVILQIATPTVVGNGGGSGGNSILWGDGAKLVVGALLAGIVGWLTQWLHSSAERRARRNALLRTLREQLITVHAAGTTNVGQVKIRGIRPLKAIEPLLSSGVLDATEDAELLSELVVLEDWAAQYNAVVTLRNQLWAQGGHFTQSAHTWETVATDLYSDLYKTAQRMLELTDPDFTPQPQQTDQESAK